MVKESVDKHMDIIKPNSLGSSDDNKLQSPLDMEAAEVKECTEQNLVANVEGITDTPESHKSSDHKKKKNYTVPKPFSLLTEKPASSTRRRSGIDNNSSLGNAATSHNSSSSSRGSQLKTPILTRNKRDQKKHSDEEDNYSIISSATSIRTNKPITVGVAPTFRSTDRLERRREFYQKLEEKQKALEAEKIENEKRLKEEQELVTKQLRKNMAYKANPVPSFYYEAPPTKQPLKKSPLTRPKSPNLNRRKSCSDTVNPSQEVKGKHCVRHRHSVGGHKEANSSPKTPNMRKSSKETPPKSEEKLVRKKTNNDDDDDDGETDENGVDVVVEVSQA